jgi:hypothetical protein
MRKKILAFVFGAALVLALAVPFLGGGTASAAPADGDAACDGANGGVDNAFAQATAPGRAGDHVPAGQVDFVVGTVTDSNPQVPATGCP